MNVNKHRVYSLAGRILSSAIWLLVFYLAIPRLAQVSSVISFASAFVVAISIFLYDSILTSKSGKKTTSAEYNFLLAGRVILSILMAWIGGFAITLSTFWSVYISYSKIYTGNYVEVFVRMVENNSSVLISLLISTVGLFIMDSLGRLTNTLVTQKSVIAEKEDTIQSQESAIQVKEQQLEQSYQQQLHIISSVQHELGNKLPIAKNTLHDLRVALNRLPEFSPDKKIRSRLPGEPESAIDTFNDLLTRLESNLFYSISIVDNIRGVLKADPSRFRPVDTFLKHYLDEEVQKHTGEIQNLQWNVQGPNVSIRIDPAQMSILLHNAIDNAKRHGFYQLHGESPLLELAIEEYINEVNLLIRNNGAPLPTEFSEEKFLKPGAVVGPTGHSGLGGYLIGMVAANHKAALRIQQAKQPFSVEIKLTFSKS